MLYERLSRIPVEERAVQPLLSDPPILHTEPHLTEIKKVGLFSDRSTRTHRRQIRPESDPPHPLKSRGRKVEASRSSLAMRIQGKACIN